MKSYLKCNKKCPMFILKENWCNSLNAKVIRDNLCSEKTSRFMEITTLLIQEVSARVKLLFDFGGQ